MGIRWQTPFTSDTDSPCAAHIFNITIAKIPQNRTIQTKTITNQQSELSDRVQFTKKQRTLLICLTKESWRNSNFRSRTHRLATIHNVTDDRQTQQCSNSATVLKYGRLKKETLYSCPYLC